MARVGSMRGLAVALGALVTAVGAWSQPPDPDTAGVVLRDGIVVHSIRAEAYVMAAEGGIAAIALDSGRQLWRASGADKPLGLFENKLIAQRAPTTAEARTRLDLATLDLDRGGTVGVRSSVELGPGLRVSTGQTLEGDFSVAVRPSDGSVLVSWSFRPETRQGLPPEVAGAGEVGPGPLAAPPALTGAVRMNPETGATTKVETGARLAPSRPTWRIQAEGATAEAPPRFESADGRHVLVSERIGDEGSWEKYRWTVLERATERKLGEVRSHLSFAPFVVRGSILVFETTPFARGDHEEPAKLRGVNLESGREAWSVPVRETVWRGTLPP